MKTKQPSTIDEYIALQPEAKQKGLQQIRQIIKKAAPKSEEVISYQMPAFKLNGILVWFAIAKNHYGFYPHGSGIIEFKDKLNDYEYSKGAIRFPLDKPLPIKLITEIVKFRVKEDEAKQALKKAKTKKR